MIKLLEIISKNRTFIDSFTILIPEANFTKVRPELHIPLYTIRSGEIIEERKPFFKIIHKGVTMRINKKYIPKLGYFFEVVATSKMLQENYFKGLDKDWYKTLEVWFFIIGFDLRSDWKKDSIIYDVDITVDFCATELEIHRHLTKLIAMAKTPICKKYFKTTEKNGKITNGIQLNLRNTASSKSPFIKIYDKYEEMSTKSKEFLKKSNLKINPGSFRLEITIKNRKHFEFLKNRINSLKSIEQLFDSEFLRKEILRSIIYQSFEQIDELKIQINKELSDLKPADVVMFSLIRSLYDVTKEKKANEKYILTYIIQSVQLSYTDTYRMNIKIKNIFRIFINSLKN